MASTFSTTSSMSLTKPWSGNQTRPWKSTGACFPTNGKSSNSYRINAVTAFLSYARYKCGDAYTDRGKMVTDKCPFILSATLANTDKHRHFKRFGDRCRIIWQKLFLLPLLSPLFQVDSIMENKISSIFKQTILEILFRHTSPTIELFLTNFL